MGAFGSCLGVGRPVSPGANPRLLGSNLVSIDTNRFGRVATHHQTKGRNGQILSQTNSPHLINGKALPPKLLRQSSGLSSDAGHQGPGLGPPFSGGPNITKLVDIDDNPISPQANISQSICNSKQGNNNSNKQSLSSFNNNNNNNNNNPNNNDNALLSYNVDGDKTQQLTIRFMQSMRANPNEVRELVALYDYERQSNDDLVISKGDHMETTQALMISDWWLARSKSTKKIGFVPKNYVAVLKSRAQLASEPWYFGKVGRLQAELRLRSPGNDDGAFIIRDSDTSVNQYSLSLLHKSDVKHYRIRQFEQGGFFINKNQVFSTVHDLVEAYSLEARGLCVKLCKPCKPWIEKPATIGLSYDTCDAWEIDRKMLAIGRELGRGQFGQVFEGIFNNQGNQVRVAIKTLRQGSMDPRDFLTEAQIMKKMSHPNLVQLYAVCTREEPVYIITELMPKGSLINYLQTDVGKNLPFGEYVNMATQIANGMSYIEKENYVHRDLAARNILVGEQNVCKIADFGLARFIHENEYEARQGARFPIKWTAPEAANNSKFSIKSDVWSFGIVLYEIITKGGTPYPEMSNAEVLSRIDNGYRMPRPPNCDVKFYDIMLKCWNKHPMERPTFDSLHEKLDQYFLSDEQYKDTTEFRVFNSKNE